MKYQFSQKLKHFKNLLFGEYSVMWAKNVILLQKIELFLADILKQICIPAMICTIYQDDVFVEDYINK